MTKSKMRMERRLNGWIFAHELDSRGSKHQDDPLLEDAPTRCSIQLWKSGLGCGLRDNVAVGNGPSATVTCALPSQGKLRYVRRVQYQSNHSNLSRQDNTAALDKAIQDMKESSLVLVLVTRLGIMASYVVLIRRFLQQEQLPQASRHESPSTRS